MKDKEILNSVKRSIDQAPIDILDNIKEAPRTKMLKHDEITKQQSSGYSYRKFLPYASVAAAFILVFLGWQLGTRMPDSRIYLDVNPSIQITTNRHDKVIDLIAENGDAEGLTMDLDYRGMTVYEVTEEILERMMKERYLDKDHEFLLLSVYNRNEEKAENQKKELDEKIHQYLQERELQPIVLAQKLDNTSTIESFAREYNISVSKMTFIRNLIILNPELETEDLVDLSIEELVMLSQGMNLNLDQIIDSSDFDRIQTPSPPVMIDDHNDDTKDNYDYDDHDEENEDEDDDRDEEDEDDDDGDYDDDDHDNHDDKDDDEDEITTQQIISPAQARTIALSVANGTITDFDYDDDDLEYEVEIEAGDMEYKVIIDARTGAVLEVEIDD